jgi:hypothetical protein
MPYRTIGLLGGKRGGAGRADDRFNPRQLPAARRHAGTLDHL